MKAGNRECWRLSGAPAFRVLFAGFLILVSDTAVSWVTGAQFAVIAAGSNGWNNYRHQSDACHAFALLRQNGVPAENIVVMLYDDVAFAPENPYPGVLINDPSCLPRKGGTGANVSDVCNVYKGCQKDYTGETVTPDNFLKVLRGDETVEDCLAKNATCNGKTLSRATDEDEIFITFFDHGGAGVLFFPGFVPLVAQDFIDVLKKMHKNRRYKQMAIYIEACNSGSLFSHLLPEDIDIYAITAAAPLEESYGCDCDLDENFPLDVCLNDCFSKDWMTGVYQHMRKRLPPSYTMEDNYASVSQKLGNANLSTACQYGNLSMASEPFRRFIASLKGIHNRNTGSLTRDDEKPIADFANSKRSAVNSRENQLHMLKTALDRSNEKYTLERALDAEIEFRRKTDAVMQSLANFFHKELSHDSSIKSKNARTDSDVDSVDIVQQQCNVGAGPADWDSECYKSVLAGYANACGPFTEYSAKYTRNLGDLCKSGVHPDNVLNAVQSICQTFSW